MCWDVVMKTNKSEMKKRYTEYTDFVRTDNGSLVNKKTMKIVNEMAPSYQNIETKVSYNIV